MLKVPHNDRTVKNLIDLPKMRLPGFKITLDSRKMFLKQFGEGHHVVAGGLLSNHPSIAFALSSLKLFKPLE